MQKLTLVLAVALLLPGVATATEVTINYKITGGTVFEDLLPITGGKFQVTVPAVTTNNLLTGMGTLQSFSFVAPGVVTARLTAPAAVFRYQAGTFRGKQKLVFSGTRRGVHCLLPGNDCMDNYSLPYSTPQDVPLSFYVNDAYPASYAFFKPQHGSGVLLGFYQLLNGLYSGPMTVAFTGEEVNRFLPEPGGTWLAMSAVASLCGLNLWARRRRRAA